MAVSVLKKRSGAHERTIREMTMTVEGIHFGPPLRDFHGVLTGTPGQERGPADPPGRR